MMRGWFRPWGWFFLPVSVPGVLSDTAAEAGQDR